MAFGSVALYNGFFSSLSLSPSAGTLTCYRGNDLEALATATSVLFCLPKGMFSLINSEWDHQEACGKRMSQLCGQLQISCSVAGGIGSEGLKPPVGFLSGRCALIQAKQTAQPQSCRWLCVA